MHPLAGHNVVPHCCKCSVVFGGKGCDLPLKLQESHCQQLLAMPAAGCLTPRSSTVRRCRGQVVVAAARGPMPSHLGPHKQKIESGARVGLHVWSKFRYKQRIAERVLCVAGCPLCSKHSDHHSAEATGIPPQVGIPRSKQTSGYLPCLAHTDCGCRLLASPLSGKWHRVCDVAKCSERNEKRHDSPAGLRSAH